MSNFSKITDFNKTFDVKTLENAKDIFLEDNKNTLKLRIDLITEEYNELLDAIKNKDISETVDALTDLLYVVYGFCDVINVDADKSFEIVHNSNMSKACNTEQEALLTKKYYLENENKRYKTPEYRLSENNKWIIFNKDTNKILKSINYNPVNFKNQLDSIKKIKNTIPKNSVKFIDSEFISTDDYINLGVKSFYM